MNKNNDSLNNSFQQNRSILGGGSILGNAGPGAGPGRNHLGNMFDDDDNDDVEVGNTDLFKSSNKRGKFQGLLGRNSIGRPNEGMTMTESIRVPGMNPMGMNQMGMNPMGMNQMGMNPMSMNPMMTSGMNSGMNPIGMNPMMTSGMNSGMNPMGMNSGGPTMRPSLTGMNPSAPLNMNPPPFGSGDGGPPKFEKQKPLSKLFEDSDDDEEASLRKQKELNKKYQADKPKPPTSSLFNDESPTKSPIALPTPPSNKLPTAPVFKAVVDDEVPVSRPMFGGNLEKKKTLFDDSTVSEIPPSGSVVGSNPLELLNTLKSNLNVRESKPKRFEEERKSIAQPDPTPAPVLDPGNPLNLLNGLKGIAPKKKNLFEDSMVVEDAPTYEPPKPVQKPTETKSNKPLKNLFDDEDDDVQFKPASSAPLKKQPSIKPKKGLFDDDDD
jgi:hypothetical protein